jgi:hypothetical protein
VAEDRGTDGARGKAHGIDPKGIQGPDQRVGIGEVKLREAGHRAVEEEIVPFDAGADRRSDDRAYQLLAMLEIGQPIGGDGCRGHEAFPRGPCSFCSKRWPKASGFAPRPGEKIKCRRSGD